jgi:hypothetical protein
MVKNKINIYPKDNLMKKLKEESEKQKRSMNNLILLILDSYFYKKEKD